MKTLGVVVVLALAVVITTAAHSDVVVFKNGTYQEGTVKSATDSSITMESQYGDLPYARDVIQAVYRSMPEQPGQEYYQAGLVLLGLHKKATAQKLFEQAAKHDARYAKLGTNALRAYTPRRSNDVASRLAPPSTTDANSRTPMYRIQCNLCGGTGKVEYKIRKVAWIPPDDYSPLMGFA